MGFLLKAHSIAPFIIIADIDKVAFLQHLVRHLGFLLSQSDKTAVHRLCH